VIRLTNVTAHAPPSSLTKVSLELSAGLHAIVGTRADGAPLLLAVASGWVRPKSGQILVAGMSPEKARPSVAYVPLDARLPTALRVREFLEVAAEVRAERAAPAPARLENLGIAALGDRLTQSLTTAEARAVLLAEALTSGVRVLLLDEPFVDIDPRAAGALPEVLREHAATGATVVIATSSPRDALELSTDQWLLSYGRLVGRLGAMETPLAVGTRLRIVARDAKALLVALAAEADFRGVELDEHALVVSGSDPAAIAAAVARASLRAGVELDAMRPDAPVLDELRGAAARRRPPSLRPPGSIHPPIPVAE
jgi:ABC-2 type transport system ATP-binding protein